MADRGAEVEAARSALRGGTGVFVVGAPGAGRTHFVQSVLSELSIEHRQRLWIRDDVQQLDDAQAAKLAHAITAGRAIPLVTVASRRSLAAPLDKLWQDGAVLRIDLTPLDATAVLRAVENFLGGPLDPAAAPSFIPRRGGGDLVVLQEAVREARTNGILVEKDGRWRLTGTIPPSEGLRGLLRARLKALTSVTPLTETVLELLGLAPELSIGHAETIVRELHPDQSIDIELERLEDDGVVEVLDRSGQLWLRLHDPVIELVLPQTMGVLRRTRLTNAIADVLERTPVAELGRGEIVSLARNALVLHRPVDADVLTQASRAALRSSRAGLAHRLAQIAVDQGGGFDAELALAAAETQLGRFGEARERLERLQPETDGDPDRARAHDELVTLVRDRISHPGIWTLPSAPSADSDAIDLAIALQLDIAPNSRATEGGVRPVSVQPGLEALEGERLSHEASLILHTGQIRRAIELLDMGEAILGPLGADMFRLQLGRSLTNSYDGHIPEALDLVERFRDEAATLGKPVQQAVCDWSLAGLLNAAGRHPEALPPVRAALELMSRVGMTQPMMLATIDLVIPLALTGGTTEAEELLQPLLNAPSDGFLLEGRALRALGWIRAGQGRLDDAAAAFERGADAHEKLGHHLPSLIGLVEAARAGHASAVLARVDAIADQVEGLTLAVSVRQVRALARTESTATHTRAADRQALAVEFDEIGEMADGAGLHQLSAEAYSHAAVIHAALGRSREAAASGRHVDDQIAICGFASLPFVVARATEHLSSREEEIATLAAAGRSSKEIAADLVLSVRTVETHLLRVYKKLGVRSRTEIADALQLPHTAQH